MLSITSAFFTDAEVNDMCRGLKSNAAKIRYLRSLGLMVHRRPNGSPLAWRPGQGPGEQVPQRQSPIDSGDEDIGVGLQAWAAARVARRRAKRGNT